jgi:Mpv17 / PMP22 family
VTCFAPGSRCCNTHPSLSHYATADVLDGVSNAWNSYNEALELHPLWVKSATAGVILGAADWTGQILEQQNKDFLDTADTPNRSIDVGRVLRFAIFGLVLQAPWNHFYYLWLDGVLPPTPEPFTTTTGIKVFIDQFVQAPIFTILIFYFLGTLEGKTPQQVQRQLQSDYQDTMLANWKLWVPATALNIAFCPPALRVLFLNGVFFFWSIFLSLKLNKSSSSEDDNPYNS